MRKIRFHEIDRNQFLKARRVSDEIRSQNRIPKAYDDAEILCDYCADMIETETVFVNRSGVYCDICKASFED